MRCVCTHPTADHRHNTHSIHCARCGCPRYERGSVRDQLGQPLRAYVGLARALASPLTWSALFVFMEENRIERRADRW